MFYVVFNIDFFFKRSRLVSNCRSLDSRSAFHFRHLDLRTSFKNTEYPSCIKNVRFFIYIYLNMNIRTTNFVFIVFNKILLFCCIRRIGQNFQNEIFADNPCHCVFLLNFQRRLQNREETEHAQSDSIYCQSVPKR